jgi:hypothetical protein
VPGPAKASTPAFLPAGDHREWRAAAGGELADGFVVGAVRLFEHEQRKAAGADLELRFDEAGVRPRRALGDPVAQRPLRLEPEAGLPQLFHVLPHGDA